VQDELRQHDAGNEPDRKEHCKGVSAELVRDELQQSAAGVRRGQRLAWRQLLWAISAGWRFDWHHLMPEKQNTRGHLA
jgi:hypothetical protein